jgi:uncharacterized protein YbjT (DUF2867 family)
MELVTGATGYVGGRLLRRLAQEERPARALVRDSSRLVPQPGTTELVEGDLLKKESLTAALEGCSVAYYLAHSMQPRVSDRDFASRDRQAAENFAQAAREVGLERIVYLGGMLPQEGSLSAHLASRLEVEQILSEAIPTTALRASIIIGAGSSPFKLLVRLVERLSVIVLPAWRDNVTCPIDERDAIEYLALSPKFPQTSGRTLDIAGPQLLAYRSMIAQISESMGVRRRSVLIGASLTSAASAIVSAVCDLPLELVRPLMESLSSDLVPRSDEAQTLYGLRLHSFERAIEHSLAEWERTEQLGAR